MCNRARGEYHLPRNNESPVFGIRCEEDWVKSHRERNFSPLVPPAAQHGTFESTIVDRLGLGEEGIPDETSERCDRAHSRPDALSSRGEPFRDGRLDLQLNLDTNLVTITQTGIPDEPTRGQTEFFVIQKGD